MGGQGSEGGGGGGAFAVQIVDARKGRAGLVRVLLDTADG
jgi:hypothetical protein